MMSSPTGIAQINKMYDDLGYLDLYSGSIIFVIAFTVLLFLAVAFLLIAKETHDIRNDWTRRRCDPLVLPFAGWISRPEGSSALEYTAENFEYCVQNASTSMYSYLMQPMQYLVSLMTNNFERLGNANEQSRLMMSTTRGNLQSIAQRVVNHVVQIMDVLQNVSRSIREVMTAAKQNTATSLYTIFETYRAFPNPGRCFDGNTMMTLKNGERRPISLIRPGDRLQDGSRVTATMKLDSSGLDMFLLKKGIIVSGDHKLLSPEGQWIKVRQYPGAIRLFDYERDFVYCLNTSSKVIRTDAGFTFLDWDELYGDNLAYMHEKAVKVIGEDTGDDASIHRAFDGGFLDGTLVTLEDKREVEISGVQVGDVLKFKERVYGIVRILATDLPDQKERSLGSTKMTTTGKLYVYPNSLSLENLSEGEVPSPKSDSDKSGGAVVYHLLTMPPSFNLDSFVFHDYNANIDVPLNESEK